MNHPLAKPSRKSRRTLLARVILLALTTDLLFSNHLTPLSLSESQRPADSAERYVKEIVEERGRFSKVFQVSADTRMMQIGMEPIHYKDEQGTW